MLCPVDVFRFEISLDGAEGPARDAALRVGGERFSKEGELAGAPGGARDLPPAGDNVEEVEVTAGGGGRLTWLVRETGPAWQVRGATVSAADGKLRIGPLRNGFSPKQEVVIAPTARAATSPFVCRLLHVDRAVITPFNPDEGSLVAHVERMVSDGARIEVASAERPDKVRGASDWRYANGVVSVAIDAPGKVELYYG
jgi:hypothetical protein